MPRTIWTITLALAAFQAEFVHADMDSLLGDWVSQPTIEGQAEVDNDASPANQQETLASHGSESVMESPPIVSNPYVVESGSDCQCSDGGPSQCSTCPPSCHSSGGCELLDRHPVVGLSECRPHQQPALPTSSFLQYFRSRNSYSNIWAGYCEETRERPRNRSHYLHGPAVGGCDGCGELIEPGCDCQKCGH